MNMVINNRFDVDESIRYAKLRLTRTIYGARHFTVVYQIPGNCNYPATCNSIIDQAESQHYRISAWSIDHEIHRLAIIHDAFEANKNVKTLETELDMSLVINNRFDVDESIRCAKLRLTKTIIYGARHFTVVYQIPGNCNYPATCNSIIDQAKSQHYRINAWSMDDEIRRLSIIHDAFEANDMNWIDEALTEDGIGDYLSLDAVIDRRNQADKQAITENQITIMQNESQFLSSEDIHILTGRKNKTQQIEWLRRNGVQHYVNMSGRPVVPKTAITGIEQPAVKQTGWKPAIVSS